MKKILLATHLNFAEGILESLQYITGEHDCIDTLCAYTKEVPDLAGAVADCVKDVSDENELIVVTDLYGGSVNNEFMKYITIPGLFVVGGLNLSLLIELATNMDMDTNEQILYAIEISGDALVYCNEKYKKMKLSKNEPDDGVGI